MLCRDPGCQPQLSSGVKLNILLSIELVCESLGEGKQILKTQFDCHIRMHVARLHVYKHAPYWSPRLLFLQTPAIVVDMTLSSTCKEFPVVPSLLCVLKSATTGFESCDSIDLHPLHAMQHHYPAPTEDELEVFMTRNGIQDSNQSISLLFHAVSNQNWSIIHYLGESCLTIPVPYMPHIRVEIPASAMRLLQNDPLHIHGNVLLTYCAMTSNLTVVRYLLYRSAVFGIDRAGLPSLPAMFMQNEFFDDAFWLLRHLLLSDEEFYIACSFLLAPIYENRVLDHKDRLANELQRRGAVDKKLLTAFAYFMHQKIDMDEMPFEISHAAISKKYPLINISQVTNFAKLVCPNDSNDLGHVLQWAVFNREWQIVHSILHSGVNPLDCRSYSYFYYFDTVYSKCLDNETCNLSDVLLVCTAFLGESAVLQYLISLHSQLQYSRTILAWLPYAAELGHNTRLAAQLLICLNFTDFEFAISVERVVTAAVQNFNIELIALIIDVLFQKQRECNVVAIVALCLKICISMDSAIEAFIYDSWITDDVLMQALCYTIYELAMQTIKLRMRL